MKVAAFVLPWIVTAGSLSADEQHDAESTALFVRNVAPSMGCVRGDACYSAVADVNDDGAVNVADVLLARGGRSLRATTQGSLARIKPTSTETGVWVGQGGSVSWVCEGLETPLVGYTLNLSGGEALPADISSSGYFAERNVFLVGGAGLDSAFSVINVTSSGVLSVTALSAGLIGVTPVAPMSDGLATFGFSGASVTAGVHSINVVEGGVLVGQGGTTIPFAASPATVRVWNFGEVPALSEFGSWVLALGLLFAGFWIRRRRGRIGATLVILTALSGLIARAEVGEPIRTLTPQPPVGSHYCASGIAFDGLSLYTTRCADSQIHRVSPVDGSWIDSFDPAMSERPAGMSYDAKRGGFWIGGQRGAGVASDFGCGGVGAVVRFWRSGEASQTAFTIPLAWQNPANPHLPAAARRFVRYCYLDGLAYRENDPNSDADDEIWFGDTVNRNVGVVNVSGTLLRGYDASDWDVTLAARSGMALDPALAFVTHDCTDASTCGRVFRVSTTSGYQRLEGTFAALFPTNGGLACDARSFEDSGFNALWVRTNPRGVAERDRITAHRMESDQCVSSGSWGACCDGIAGTCQDGVTAAQCPSPQVWTEGRRCVDLNDPCFSARRLFLLDRTGSMNAVRADTVRRRCEDSIESARVEVERFFDSRPAGSTAAVWTFAGEGPTPRTSGFVDQGGVLQALDEIAAEPCAGLTPLAESICAAADQLANQFPLNPLGSLELSIETDGGENHSGGDCAGPTSLSGASCGEFDDGSWQRKVCDRVVGRAVGLVRSWGSPAQTSPSATPDDAVSTTAAGGIEDAVFFQALAAGSGGVALSVQDQTTLQEGIPVFGVTGACCREGVVCLEGLTEAECSTWGGVHLGAASTCPAEGDTCTTLVPAASAPTLIALAVAIVSCGAFVIRRGLGP